MSEKPILFSGPMVRAILEGRKSMTRRVVSLGKNCHFGATGSGKHHDYDWSRAEVRNHSLIEFVTLGKEKIPMLHVPFCHKGDGWEENPEDDTVDRLYPIWQVGDRLWVRETWAEFPAKGDVIYRAEPELAGVVENLLWRPSIFMPRWASRLTLEVTAVRVERLQDATLADCIAEACPYLPGIQCCDSTFPEYECLEKYWDFLNAKRGHSWESNPWVWCITFKVVPQ